MQQPTVSRKVSQTMMQADREGAGSFLYERIYLELKAEILSGAYAEGDWFPPERALKDRFATTHLTVRNALAKLVQEGFIERHSGKGTIVIYSGDRKRATQSSLSPPRALLLVPEPDEAVSALMIRLEERLRRIQLPLSVSLHRGDPALEKSLYASAAEARILVILCPSESPGSLLDSGVELPNTILVRTGIGAAPCAQVQIDIAGGVREAVRHLIDLGHSEIALLSRYGPEGDLAREAWASELGSNGMSVDRELQATCADGVEPAWPYFPITVDAAQFGKSRDDLFEECKRRDILPRRYFYPLISSFVPYRDLPSAAPENLPVAARFGEQILCLPIFPDIAEEEIERTITVIKATYGRKI